MDTFIKTKKSSKFSPTKLLVVIAIIATPVGLVLLSLGPSRSTTRDAQPEAPPEEEKTTIPPLVLAQGKQTYYIRGGGGSPQFMEAVIDPLDVKVGDTQIMSVKIRDTYSITTVTAAVETDTGIKTYTLSLIEGTDTNGRWQGSWVVQDTHSATYRTTFTAKDSNNETSSVTLTWTDPCSIPPNNDPSWTLDGNCNTGTGVVTGVDNGNFYVPTSTALTIDANSTFVWNPLKSIYLQGGSIAINSTGQLKQTNLWMIDADSDGYPLTTTQYAADTAPTPDYKRRHTMNINYFTDTGDTNACTDALCTGTCQACNVAGSLGVCTNIPVDTDPDSECSGLDCDGGVTKYYYGWVSGTCYYNADVSDANAVCNGSGACKTAADQCPSSGQGLTTGVSRTTCKTQVGCTGTTIGSLGDVADGSDTYSDCSGLDCDGGVTKYYYGWVSGTCYYNADVSDANAVCNGSGACKTAADQCPSSGQGLTTGVSRTTCKTMVDCTGTTVGTLGNVAIGSDSYSDCTGTSCCYSCNGAGACANIAQGSTCTASAGESSCTATHYRCDGSGSCTAPCSASTGCIDTSPWTPCNTYCTNGGYCGCYIGYLSDGCLGYEQPCSYYAGDFPQSCSCYLWQYNSPHIHSYNGSTYEFISDFGVSGEENEKTFFTEIPEQKIKETDGKYKLKIKGDENEITYLDKIHLKITDIKGDDKIIYKVETFEDLSEIKESDENYLILNQGEEVFLEFDAPELKQGYQRKIEFVAEGYYEIIRKK